MTSDGPIPFTQIIKALLDTDTPFHARYLHSFSDIQSEELELLEASWSDIPTWRRQALMEDIEELGVRDTLLSFEAFGRFALQDSDPGVRTLAIQTLCEFDTRDLAPIFINLLGSDQDPAVRAAAGTGLQTVRESERCGSSDDPATRQDGRLCGYHGVLRHSEG